MAIPPELVRFLKNVPHGLIHPEMMRKLFPHCPNLKALLDKQSINAQRSASYWPCSLITAMMCRIKLPVAKVIRLSITRIRFKVLCTFNRIVSSLFKMKIRWY